MQNTSKFIILIYVFVCIGCPRSGTDKEKILVWINDEGISVSEFDDELKKTIKENDYILGEGIPRELKIKILKEMVKKRVLLKEAEILGIKITDDELEGELEKFKEGYSGEGFKRELIREYINYDEWVKELKEILIIEKLVRQEVDSRVSIDDEEVGMLYEENIDEFKIPHQVRARHIVVRSEDEALEILKKLKKGGDFGDLARAGSISPDARMGGEIGYFSQSEMPEEFNVCFSLRVKKLSSVVKSPYGYHIFQVLEKKDPRTLSFEEVEGRIRKRLRMGKREEFYEEWIKKVQSKYKITYNKKLGKL